MGVLVERRGSFACARRVAGSARPIGLHCALAKLSQQRVHCSCKLQQAAVHSVCCITIAGLRPCALYGC